MNEININIEGYNVNGICVGCLNYDRKMFYCSEVKECFKTLGNIDVPDGLSIQVCWECLAAVRSALKFQEQMLKSFNVLMEYSRQHTFLNSPMDLSQHASKRFAIAESTDIILMYHEEQIVKSEPEAQIEVKEEEETVPEILKAESDYDSLDNYEESFQKQEDSSSDEDIKLSKLKKKREKKEPKKSKRAKKRKKEEVTETTTDVKKKRKLKNLPEDSVDLIQLDEETMWTVRRDDAVNKDFVKLKYKCSDCIISFNSEKLMKDHMQGKHVAKTGSSNQCDVCLAYFVTTDNLSSHRALHLTGYSCKVCQYVTSLKRLMVKHVALHEGNVKSERFECPHCEKKFSTKSRLNYHKTVCNQEKPQCDCCGKVFANKVTLKYHLKATSGEKTESKPLQKLYIKCVGCPKVFFSKKSYRAHVVVHEGVQYPCPVCGKPFRWKRNLGRHLRNHAERDAGARHECRACGKKFASRDCLANHLRFSRRHVPEDALGHACDYCGKKFATKWCMIDHIDWDHLKKIKYQCSVCMKAFKTAKILVAHMNNIHEGKKNKEPDGEHLCDICGKSYKTVKRLKGHVWAMHTQRSTSKSFKCALCPATFTWQTSVYKHVKMMHQNPRRATKHQRPVAKPEPFSGLQLTASYFPQVNVLQHTTPEHDV